MHDFINWIRSISHGDQVQAVIVAAVIMVVTAIVTHLVVKLVKRATQSDGVPLPSSSIIVNILRVALWVTGVSVMLSVCFDVDVHGFIAALGVGGVALSLGLQDTVKNLIGGLQVTLTKIVQPGDHIIVGSTEGIVQDVTWRQTVVRDYENSTHLIPNSVINSTEVTKVQPDFLVSTVVVLNNDGRNLDAVLREMELLAKMAVEKVAPLEKDPWFLVTQIGEYGTWAKMRFVLKDVTCAREARDAALRVIAPYTRSNADQILLDNGDED